MVEFCCPECKILVEEKDVAETTVSNKKAYTTVCPKCKEVLQAFDNKTEKPYIKICSMCGQEYECHGDAHACPDCDHMKRSIMAVE
jgi:hypothetical protein